MKRLPLLNAIISEIFHFQALSERLSADKKKYPGKFYPYKCDISIEKEIRDTFASIKKNLGPISVLVNNAGVMVKDDIKLLGKNYSTRTIYSQNWQYVIFQ